MDWTTILSNGLSIVETAALLGALVFATKAAKQAKNSPDKKKQMRRSVCFVIAFVVLNVVRGYCFAA